MHRHQRLDRAAADAAARRARHRQDALRAQDRAAARHRLRLRADELAHRRLGAVRRLLAVEERQARQGVRHLPERRLRQPGDRGGRDRQGERRRPVRPARRALRAARDRDRDPVRRRIRRAADRRLGRGVARHGQRRRAHSRAAAQPARRSTRSTRPTRKAPRASRGTIYREIRNSHDWGRQFPEALSAAALERLAGLPPREMRRAIQSAFGNAKIAGRSEVGPDDIQDPRGRRQRIGF